MTGSVGLTRESNDRVLGDQSTDDIVTNAMSPRPFSPVRGTTFGYGGIAQNLIYSNPVATAAYSTVNARALRALGHREARLTATDRLTLTGRVGTDVYGIGELRWRSPKVDREASASVGGEGASGRTSATRDVSEAFGSCALIRNDRQQLALTGGSSLDYNYAASTGFPTGFERSVRNGASVSSHDGGATSNTLVSYFARATWSMRDEYLVSASFRTDVSSRCPMACSTTSPFSATPAR